ncbi:hypothetical protein QEG73_19470 [Chitinophagaceae bacterium 26-R-25]|nr:hypothetical protein [Chitinophagaceae bacterium 26-R-25]
MSFIKELLFDKELVATLRTTQVDPDILYMELMNGKITLKEYFAALQTQVPVR